MTITIYHKPNCVTSRKVLSAIRARGGKPRIVHYLVDTPSRTELVELMAMMGTTPRGLLRRKNTPFDELGLDHPKWSDEQLIDFMLAHPVLIDRPIVVANGRAALIRSPEQLVEFLAADFRGEQEYGHSAAS